MQKAEGRKLWLRRVQGHEWSTIKGAAEADGHEMVAPSHVMLKDGQIVGAMSIGMVPLVLPWFDTKKCTARDSLYFINQGENLLAELMPANGQDLICVPFAEGSPFAAHIEGLEFVNAGKFHLTFKKVR